MIDFQFLYDVALAAGTYYRGGFRGRNSYGFLCGKRSSKGRRCLSMTLRVLVIGQPYCWLGVRSTTVSVHFPG